VRGVNSIVIVAIGILLLYVGISDKWNGLSDFVGCLTGNLPCGGAAKAADASKEQAAVQPVAPVQPSPLLQRAQALLDSRSGVTLHDFLIT
jgi:hypothetical protein